MRSPFIYTGLLLLLIRFSIEISDASREAKYLGVFLCTTESYASFAGAVTWLGNNLWGQYKRGVGVALQIGIGNFGGAIASNIFRMQDAPRYILAHGVVLMFVGIGLIAVPLVVVIYTRYGNFAKPNSKSLFALPKNIATAISLFSFSFFSYILLSENALYKTKHRDTTDIVH